MPSGGGGQQVVQTGPSFAATQAAAQAQIASAQAAAQASMQNTNSALQALMGQYTTSLGLTQPIRAEGNQAAAQLNYLLGLPAANPGNAPTAPTAPTLQGISSNINQADINNYIASNSTLGPYNIFDYHGAMPSGAPSGGVGAQGQDTRYGFSGLTAGDVGDLAGSGLLTLQSNPNIQNAARMELAQEALNNPYSIYNTQYQLQQQQYNQQLDAYNQAKGIYDQYNAKGVASPEDIANIVTNLPGFKFNQQQGLSQIENSASAKGMLNSGNLLRSLDEFGQGLSQTYFNNYAGQLSGLAGLGVGQSQQAASNANAIGGAFADQFMNNGTNQGNAYLAAGQAQASSFLNALQNQQINTTSLGGGSSLGNSLGGLLGGVGSIMGAFK